MMNISDKRWISAIGAISAFGISAAAWAADGFSTGPGADYDRLDGTGASGEKASVIEWQGNLEIHVYPAGSLKGLALKLDRRDKDRPVMVIGYRFSGDPGKQLIRRAILGIDLRDGFKAYRDSSVDDYDKIIISDNGLSLARLKLDPPPTRLYPDGYPSGQTSNAIAVSGSPGQPRMRQPATVSQDQPQQTSDGDSGTIQPLFIHPKARR